MVAPPKLVAIALGEAVDRFLEAALAQARLGRRSVNTVKAWIADLHDLAELLGEDIVVDDITGDDIDDALDRFSRLPDRRRTRQDERSGKSVDSRLRFERSLAALFNHALLEGWVQQSPMPYAKLRGPRRPPLRVKRTALSTPQAADLVRDGAAVESADRRHDARRHESIPVRNRLIVEMLVKLGPRVSELVSANIADFFPETRSGVRAWWWRIVGKGDKVRPVAVPNTVKAHIDAYMLIRPLPTASAGDALLLSGRGNRLSSRDVQRIVDIAAKHADLHRSITPHALRHTTATQMVQAGYGLSTVARALGHASIATTDGYIDPEEAHMAQAMNSVSTMLDTE
ncbi:MAG: tyrosine-type recombinase/integrase [Bifidobacteriaceae bacterium]|nr:tyrosine-type recombinase/integrase [Bifidobacteriaceae bacterium]